MTDRLVCVGSYTEESGAKGKGITTYWQDAATGELTPCGSLRLPSPSWLEWHPARPVLYAANELEAGSVTALAVDDRGALTVLGTEPTGGATPCHLAITADARHLLAANYGSGSVSVFALDDDGRITGRTDLVEHAGNGPVTDRQEGPHAHMVVVDGALVTVIDLGTDEIRGYRLTDDGRLTAEAVSPLPPGTGPRQLARGRDHAYVVGELAASLVTLDETAPGVFVRVGEVRASQSDARNLPAQLTLSADARHAYLSNRGPNTIAVFSLDGAVPDRIGETPAGSGWPRHFAISGEWLYAATQDGDEVVQFTVDSATGLLTEQRRYAVGTPACVAPQPG
jgi:6-phosphogluconolactonase (cycloisomerase 2 family)